MSFLKLLYDLDAIEEMHPILHEALGPDDPFTEAVRKALETGHPDDIDDALEGVSELPPPIRREMFGHITTHPPANADEVLAHLEGGEVHRLTQIDVARGGQGAWSTHVPTDADGFALTVSETYSVREAEDDWPLRVQFRPDLPKHEIVVHLEKALAILKALP